MFKYSMLVLSVGSGTYSCFVNSFTDERRRVVESFNLDNFSDATTTHNLTMKAIAEKV